MAKQVSPGVLALRKVVDDVHKEAREAKARGELVGWSSSKFPCELAAAFDLHVMYPENQAAGIAANRYGELMCQAAEDLGYDNDICGYARISLAYAAGVRVSRKYDPETGEYIIDPSTGKPLKDADGNVVMGEDGKPKKDPKTQTPYLQLDNLLEIEKLPDGPEKEKRLEAISPIRQMRIPQPDFVLCCNNICNCMTKWYENIARMCNIPLIMIDIPYNNTVEVHDENVKYVRAQFDKAIKQLEELTGKKFDEKLEVGTMIETPAAVLIADELAEECDFFSIGTNDLTQYTCALDRQNAKLEPFFNPHHPAVLRAIKMTIDAGHRHGIWVGICGELGADTALTETFLRMGVDELSMNAKSVLPVRKIIRSIDLSKPSDK